MIVTINGLLNRDFGLDFLHKEISSPEPKISKISIPLRDGDLDLTDNLSEVVRYNNREIALQFEIRTMRCEWPETMRALYKSFHGKTVEVIFSDDPNYCWTGRCSVGALEDHGFTAGVSFTIDAEPFKRTLEPIITKSFDVDLVALYQFEIDEMRGYPEFITEDNLQVLYHGERWQINAEKRKAYGMVFFEGNDEIRILGTGTVLMNVYGGAL